MFVQPFAFNVNMYVTLIGAVVVLIRISLGLPVPAPAALLIPTTTALVHIMVVPGVAVVGLYENIVLLQIAAGVSVLVSVGVGFTATITL